MLKERVCTSSDQEISGSTRISSVKMYETPAGPLLLRRCCSPSLVGGLKAGEGAHCFSLLPSNQKVC